MAADADQDRSSSRAQVTNLVSLDLQLREVRSFVRGRLIVSLIGLTVLTALQAYEETWGPPVMGALVVAVLVLNQALHFVRKRRLVPAVVVTAVSNWSLALIMSFVVPLLFIGFATLTMWPLLQAIPYVDRTTLRRLMLGTVPVAVTAVALATRGDPYGVEEAVGSTLTTWLTILIGAAIVTLTVLLVWTGFERLENATTALVESNRALQASEAVLEEKVFERTQQLAESSAYVTAVIDNLGPGLVAVDARGRPTRMNDTFRALFPSSQSGGDLPDELAGILEAELHPGDQRSAHIDMAGGRVGKVVASPIEVTTEDGETEVIGAVLTVDDVSHEREVDRMKTDFISMVSHELRTPLTSVLGFTRMIQKRLGDYLIPALDRDAKGVDRAVNQVTTNLEVILSEGERLTSLINDVLDISKMEAGRIEWEFAPTDIGKVIDQAVEATSALFAGSGLELDVEVPEGLPELSVDTDRMVQVVINLLSNARKFTDEGSVVVRASLDESTGDIVVAVTDTGIGISKADLPSVFERFRQVGDTLTDRPTGTGLGLPICQEIVEGHAGRISVSSAVGTGSTFEVRLPVDRN